MKKFFPFFFLALISLPAFAQEADTRLSKKEERRRRINALGKLEEEGVITHRKHFAFGAKLTTDGYGGWLELGRARSVKKQLLFQLDISERKHSKEEKQQFDFSSSAPVIYGKINFFYPVKLGVQQQILLGNKGNKNGVSVTANVGGGLSMAMLRPYLITVNINGEEKSIDFNSDSLNFLSGDIRRGPGFGKGWNKLKFTPGLYIKPAVRFDYGKYNEMINALEAGVVLEYYTKEIQQMAFQKDRKLFFSGYVALVFGKRK